MVINHNMSALFANRQLGVTQANLTNSMEKLSSGLRINKAADDASGLAVSEKMRSQIRGLNQAGKNIENGVSFIQTTEGFLQETQDILGRMRELSVEAANGIYSDEDRGMIQVEVSQLVQEIDRIATQSQFNGMNLLSGAFAQGQTRDGLQLQVGANMDQNAKIYVGTMTSAALGITTQSVDLANAEGANNAIGTLDAALSKVSKQRADLGAYQNRFETAQQGVAISAENLTAAESRIRDTDMASEMVQYTRDAILSQAGTAMLAQANTRNQSVLQLLG
jgi:flagellin